MGSCACAARPVAPRSSWRSGAARGADAPVRLERAVCTALFVRARARRDGHRAELERAFSHADAGRGVSRRWCEAGVCSRRGILVRTEDSGHLELEPQSEEDALAGLQCDSITYRVAVGRRQRQKAFTLQTLGARGEGHGGERLAQANGFSLHAGVAAEAEERGKLERLCRYISRPAVATQRLSLTAQGEIRYALKTPYRDGTTHVVFEPEDFILRLAALVPSPRVNLTRFHGVLAPHHRLRARISARRSERSDGGAGSGKSRSSALGWAQRLKRVFSIDVERCDRCGGGVRIIACIEDAEVIEARIQCRDAGGGPGRGRKRRKRAADESIADRLIIRHGRLNAAIVHHGVEFNVIGTSRLSSHASFPSAPTKPNRVATISGATWSPAAPCL